MPSVMSKDQSTSIPRVHSSNPSIGKYKLLRFLRKLLDDVTFADYIVWTDKEKSEFEFLQHKQVARVYGEYVNSQKMTYDGMCRSIRYFCHHGMMEKVFGRPKSWRFLVAPFKLEAPLLADSLESEINNLAQHILKECSPELIDNFVSSALELNTPTQKKPSIDELAEFLLQDNVLEQFMKTMVNFAAFQEIMTENIPKDQHVEAFFKFQTENPDFFM